MARALLALAALLLGVPGAFVVAKGLAAVRRRSVLVSGRIVEGRKAMAAGAVLMVYGLVMIAVAAVILVAAGARG